MWRRPVRGAILGAMSPSDPNLDCDPSSAGLTRLCPETWEETSHPPAKSPRAAIETAHAERRAVFLDRDGTLIEYVPELSDPQQVRLVPGAGHALASLRRAGFLCIVVTNQPLVGRGLLGRTALDEIHARLAEGLSESGGGAIDAFYACPVPAAGGEPDLVEHPDRKPGPGMLLRAARAHGIDLARSCMVGDSLRDVLAGRNAGCGTSILVRTGVGERFARASACFDHLSDDLPAAVAQILADNGAG